MKFPKLLSCLCITCCLFACAEPDKKPEESEPARAPAATNTTSAPSSSLANTHSTSSDELRELLTQLGKRIEILETQVASMNDKMDSNRVILDRISGAKKTKMTEVIAHPSEASGVTVAVKTAPHDPEGGFVNDEAIQLFRKAMILFQAQKYPEAVLGFSAFLEKYPDHPVAGSAQFYVGESYMKQKEYKLAIQEFQRVLTSYDRSSHVSDTLSEMALAEETLKKSQTAAVHRQLLTSLFPQSPAASPQSAIGTSQKTTEDSVENTAEKPISPAPAPLVEDMLKTPMTAPIAAPGDVK